MIGEGAILANTSSS